MTIQQTIPILALFLSSLVTAGENYFFAIGVCLPWMPPVQACANNVKLIQEALSSRLPLTARHIKTLLGPEATYPAVIAGFAWLQNAAVPEDTVIIYYSGHGVLVDDENGDEASDMDEAFCLWSKTPPFSRMAAVWSKTWMLDDEFGGQVRAIRARRKIVIADTCHGSAADRAILPAGKATDYEQGDAALLAAALADQLALSTKGGDYGLFTEHLAQAISAGTSSLREAFDQAQSETLAESRQLCRLAAGKGELACTEQTPTLTDPLGLTNTLIFLAPHQGR